MHLLKRFLCRLSSFKTAIARWLTHHSPACPSPLGHSRCRCGTKNDASSRSVEGRRHERLVRRTHGLTGMQWDPGRGRKWHSQPDNSCRANLGPVQPQQALGALHTTQWIIMEALLAPFLQNKLGKWSNSSPAPANPFHSINLLHPPCST